MELQCIIELVIVIFHDWHWRVILNPLVAGSYSHATCSNCKPQKNIALVQMASDVRLLPYLAQLTIRSVPSLKGSVILLGSTGRRCIVVT